MNKEEKNEYERNYRETHKAIIFKQQHDWYLAHREEIIENGIQWRKNFRKEHGFAYYTKYTKGKKLEILKLLGNKCVKCGFLDIKALCIDHVNGGGNKERNRFHNDRGKYYKYVLEKIKTGSDDYQILCANCNMIKLSEKKEYLNGHKNWGKM